MLEDEFRRIQKRIAKAKRRIEAGKGVRKERRGVVKEEDVLVRLIALLNKPREEAR